MGSFPFHQGYRMALCRLTQFESFLKTESDLYMGHLVVRSSHGGIDAF